MFGFYPLPKSGDFSENLKAALDGGKRKIYIPCDEYTLKTAIRLPSGTYIRASKKAHIKTAAGFSGLFVFANSDFDGGNENITITGGIWDGNCGEIYRASYKDTENPGMYFVFDNVKNLVIKNIEMKNAVCYHIRLFKCTDFVIENVDFTGELHPLCQDGIHLNGGCERGTVKNITALCSGDDLIALNADEALFYGQGIGVENLPIRDITVENVKSENCWTGVRLLSIDNAIENVVLKNFTIGYNEFGINMDATRFAGDKLFDAASYPNGVGHIKNVVIENFSAFNVGAKPDKETVIFAENVENFVIKNFKRLKGREPENVKSPTLNICYLAKTDISGDINMTVENQGSYADYSNEYNAIGFNRK